MFERQITVRPRIAWDLVVSHRMKLVLKINLLMTWLNLPSGNRCPQLLSHSTRGFHRVLMAKCANDLARIKKLEDEIGLICYEIEEAIVHHLDQGEKRAVDKIKVNHKYFYSLNPFLNCPDKSLPTFTFYSVTSH